MGVAVKEEGVVWPGSLLVVYWAEGSLRSRIKPARHLAQLEVTEGRLLAMDREDWWEWPRVSLVANTVLRYC